MQFWNILSQFWTIFSIQVKKQMAYRLNFVLPYFFRIFQLVGSIFIWHTLFNDREEINGYTFPEIVNYLIFAQISLLVLYPSHLFSLQGLIKKGSLSSYLYRPCSFMFTSWSEFIGTKCTHFLFFIMLTQITGLVPLLEFKQIFIVLLSLSLSFFFGFFISTFAFYIVEMWPIRSLFIAGMAIFGGTIIPLDLLPESISLFSPYTPFAYFSYVNVKVLQGALSDEIITVHLLNLVFQNALFWSLSILLFSRGLKRYECSGC